MMRAQPASAHHGGMAASARSAIIELGGDFYWAGAVCTRDKGRNLGKAVEGNCITTNFSTNESAMC